jgi:hypothetical protein
MKKLMTSPITTPNIQKKRKALPNPTQSHNNQPPVKRARKNTEEESETEEIAIASSASPFTSEDETFKGNPLKNKKLVIYPIPLSLSPSSLKFYPPTVHSPSENVAASSIHSGKCERYNNIHQYGTEKLDIAEKITDYYNDTIESLNDSDITKASIVKKLCTDINKYRKNFYKLSERELVSYGKNRNTLIHFLNLHYDSEIPIAIAPKILKKIETSLEKPLNVTF